MLKEYYEDPFGFVDRLDLTIKGHNLNIFHKYRRLRKTAFFLALIGLVMWVFMGFDSTIGQVIHPLYALPQLISGKIAVSDLVSLFHSQYGKEMHWSAFVIYGLMFWGLSRHYETALSIKGSKNIVYATSLTLLSIAVFEFYWMASFSYFQNQPWVIIPKMPQLRIHLQNLAFLFAGIMGVFYLYVDSHIFNSATEIVGRKYHLRIDGFTASLLCISIMYAVLWWYYPGNVQPLSVTYETGEIWHNTAYFPQSLYTIDVNPTDNINAGVWFYLGDDVIHGLNTLVKTFFTLTIGYIGAVVKCKTQQR